MLLGLNKLLGFLGLYHLILFCADLGLEDKGEVAWRK